MTVKINFAGDIALFRQFEEEQIDPLGKVALPSADYSIANFEFIQPAEERNESFFAVEERYCCGYSYFKSLDLHVFDAYSLANNHAMDYGPEGIGDVAEVLEAKGISWFGASKTGEDRLLKFTLEGIRFIVIAAASKGRWSKENFDFGPESLDEERINALIKEHHDDADHIILFLHWGTELVDVPPPENVEQAKRFIDLGASAVVGHHPHVPQGIQNYKHGVIAYSLGSYIYIPSEERGYEPGIEGRDISIIFSIEFSKTKIESTLATYYKFNPLTLLPEIMDPDTQYILGINANVANAAAYTKKVRTHLLKREIRLFAARFRDSPMAALVHYYNYLGVKQVRKLLGF